MPQRSAPRPHSGQQNGPRSGALSTSVTLALLVLLLSAGVNGQLLRKAAIPIVPVDPLLPTGGQRLLAARPRHLAQSACSAFAPVCIHYNISTSQREPASLLAAFERSYQRLVYGLNLPGPLPDSGLGPTSGLDLYLEPATVSASYLQVFADPKQLPGDTSSAYCLGAANSSDFARLTSICVAEALLVGINAGASTHLRRSIATYLATLWGVTSHDLWDVERLQSNPHLSLIARDFNADAPSSWPLIAYLDQKLGTTPGALPVALLQQSRNASAPGAIEWQNEPDALEVLRQALETEQRFGNFFLNFSVQRAFWGSRDTGNQNPTLRWLHDAGRVRFDWLLETSSLPRRVAAQRPVEPMGSAYLWLQLDKRKPNTSLAFRSEWEPPANFRWTLVAVNRHGVELKRFDLPYVRGASSAERTLPNVPEAVAYIIVGFNLGGVDRKHPFDPDHEPWEPHGFTVYLAEVQIAGQTGAAPEPQN